MKKKINNIPKNKFGAADITNIGNTVTSIANTGIQAAQDSKENGANVGKAFVTSLGTSFQGFQTGMTVGGPIGGIVGGVAGGLAGLIPGLLGRKGSVDSVTGEITTPSGIKGWRGPSIEDLRDRSRQIKRNNAFRNFNNTAAYEYYQDNGYNDYTMVANGGIIPNALAYVDDGELLRTPDGKIIDIPEQGKPTDSNLVSVPEGTQVLSDKLKVPGTKETFAEVGKRIMKKQKYGNDKYAKNSEMLNNINNQMAYDNLLNLQEDMKDKKGIKEKVGKYSPGTRRIRNVQSTADYATDIYGTEPYWDAWSRINLGNYQTANDLQKRYFNLGLYNTGDYVNHRDEVADYQTSFNSAFNPINQQIGNLRSKGTIVGRGGTSDTPTEWQADGYAGYQTALRHLGRNADAKQLTNINARLFARGLEAYNDPQTGMVLTRPISRADVSDEDLRDLRAKQVPESRTSLADLADTTQAKTIPTTSTTGGSGASKGIGEASNIMGNIDSMISGLSSIVANLQNSKDTEPEPVYPRYARAYFSPVEYDINPLLAEINRANAIARYNETQLAPRTGANLAYGIQAAVARNKAINDAYYNQSNINNQTRARNAQMAANTSQFNAHAQHTADVEYAQNRAAARNLRRQYRAANAQIIPSMLRDIRRNERDQAILEYMSPYLRYGVTDEMWDNVRGGLE